MKVMGMDVAGEVPPPYIPPGVPGLVTVTGTLPEVAIAEFGMVAVSLVVPPEVVVMAVPLKFTTALPLKFVPVTTREKPGCWEKSKGQPLAPGKFCVPGVLEEMMRSSGGRTFLLSSREF